MDIAGLYRHYRQNPSVETDTRKLKQGDIFFALKGDNFNGNAFAAAAIEKGASLAVIDEAQYEVPGKTILVENALETLQQLAKYHRDRFSIPFIAITGSNGKTTTKELVHAVLSGSFKTYTTEGNLNNHIGIPLTLLKIRHDAEMAVVEMGANHIGEIAGYCKYVSPTHGLITNCGKAHLEGFGSEEGVRKAKGELFDSLRERNDGVAFVMWDYDYLRTMSKGISGIIKYGTTDAHVTGFAKDSASLLEVDITQGMEPVTIHTQLVGGYNTPNVLAAVTIGKYFKIPEADIVKSIEAYTPSNSRSQLKKLGSNTVILDAYNANPSSMKVAIENFSKMPVENKVLVLGAMAELGNDSVAEHEAIAELIGKYKWKDVILVGGDFLKIKHAYKSFENAKQAGEWMKEQNWENTHLLVKGSRSSKMEQVIDL